MGKNGFAGRKDVGMQVYRLLTLNYVEDDDNMFRSVHSLDLLQGSI